MATKTNLNITLDKELIKLIDTDRGQTPRSSFINSILSKFFKKSHQIFDWGEENRLAQEDLKVGRAKKFATKSEAMKWLKN
jgi:hypothetical protein